MAHFEKKIFVKDRSYDPIFNSVNTEFYFKTRFLPGVLISLGFIILVTQVVIPLVYFKTQDEVSPAMQGSVLGVASGFGDFKFDELEENTTVKTEKALPKYFYVTIPKLNIDRAVVETNSPSLSPDLSLGHYNGSGIPGEIGNAFIYGHSVLPWFYNPKNYKTIFSTLDKLSVGDTFTVYYDNKVINYKVESTEVLPVSKVNPLAEFKPRYLNESTITLMTCYPMGAKSKRYLVNAVMVNPDL